MSVERLPSGGWRARWRDSQGKEHSRGSRRWRKRDAEAFERRMLDEREQGISATAGDMTVAELAEQWLHASRHLADSSVKTYRRELDHDILPVLGHLRIAKVRAEDIDGYLAGLAAAGRASTTQRRHLQSIISPMFSYARARRLVATSPATDVSPPRLEHGEQRFLTMPELRVLAGAFPERWRALILFTGIMGPRWGEVWRIRPADIKGSTVLIRGTKSKRSLRRVTMPRFVQSIVAGQLFYFATEDSLWPTSNGQAPKSGESWRANVWRPSLERSGLPKLRFHDLRHTAAALAVQSGANPLLVQRRLGHASISITLGTYGHLFPEADEAVADGLDAMWEEM
jgi:integrase